jgi:hypothetical protein
VLCCPLHGTVQRQALQPSAAEASLVDRLAAATGAAWSEEPPAAEPIPAKRDWRSGSSGGSGRRQQRQCQQLQRQQQLSRLGSSSGGGGGSSRPGGASLKALRAKQRHTKATMTGDVQQLLAYVLGGLQAGWDVSVWPVMLMARGSTKRWVPAENLLLWLGLLRCVRVWDTCGVACVVCRVRPRAGRGAHSRRGACICRRCCCPCLLHLPSLLPLLVLLLLVRPSLSLPAALCCAVLCCAVSCRATVRTQVPRRADALG